MVLSYLDSADGRLIPATGVDMILEKMDTRFERYLQLSKKLTLNETKLPMLPEIYSVLFPITEKDPLLGAITSEEITTHTKLGQKLLEEFAE